MRLQGANSVGRLSIDFEVANNDDMGAVRRGTLDPDKVRRMTISGLVDSGATRLVLPKAVAKQLGLETTGKVKVRYADGRTARRDAVAGAYVKIMGRGGVFTATVEPKRQNALVGAIVMEDLDFVIDCIHSRLVPRDPDYLVSEEE